MNRLILVGVMLGLGACSPLSAITDAPGPSSHQATLKAMGEHLEGCDRRYQGGFGLGASFTFNIDCRAQRRPED